jgi:hypothetical protein
MYLVAFATNPDGTHAEEPSYLWAKPGLWSWLTTVISVMSRPSSWAACSRCSCALELLTPGPHHHGRGHLQPHVHAARRDHGVPLHHPVGPGGAGQLRLPIMLGAKDVAFPRLNLMSFYIYVFGAVFCLYSIVSGAVDTGWTFYTPYSTSTSSSVVSMTLGVFILGFSSILTGLNFIVTIHKLRAPGLHWRRLPLFVWGMYATSIIQVLATPVLAITLLLLAMERVLGLGIFDPRSAATRCSSSTSSGSTRTPPSTS